MRSFETVHIHRCDKHQRDTKEEQDERTLFKVLDVAAREGDADFVEFCGGHGAGSIVFFFALSDVTHIEDSGD